MTRFQTTLSAALFAALAPAASQAGLLTDDGTLVLVVVNHEEQYSILPVGTAIPRGWKSTGKTCTEEACMRHIEEVWTDMRPLTIRQFVEKQYRQHMKGQ